MPTLQSYMAYGADLEQREGYAVIKRTVSGFDRESLILPNGYDYLAALPDHDIDVIGNHEDKTLFVRMGDLIRVFLVSTEDTYYALLGTVTAKIYLLKHA